MTIPLYRLPEGIERGSQFGPAYYNVIQEAIAGNEQRFARWNKCRCVGDLSYGIRSTKDPLSAFKAVLYMYRAHFGSLIPFRFRDWGDYEAENELFGTGNGVRTDFQIVKTYDPSMVLLGVPGSLLYVRTITLLDGNPTIMVDGVEQELGVDFAVGSSGIVSFASPVANGKPVTWTGQFDVPVRFDLDPGQPLPIILNEADLAEFRSIPIREVIGES